MLQHILTMEYFKNMLLSKHKSRGVEGNVQVVQKSLKTWKINIIYKHLYVNIIDTYMKYIHI